MKALRRVPPLEGALFVAAIAVLVAFALLGGRGNGGDALASYSSYDAGGGGYRAWYELLAREGVPVERFAARPALLDRSFATLVWSEPLPFDPRQSRPTKADVAALEAWVRGGGRLLYIGSDDAAAREGLLQLPLTRPPAAGGTPLVASSLRAAGVRTVRSSAARRWWVPNGARVLVADGGGPLALAYALGGGEVVAVVDERLFANDAIAEGDRARLAYALAAPQRPGGVVAFDETPHGYGVPEHWWSVVPRPFAAALALAALAVLVAIAGAAVRLGPPIVPLERTDRSSADFVAALASLLERGGAAGKALSDATRSATRAVARALGMPESASGPELAARLPPGELRTALETLLALPAGTPAAAHDLTRGVALAARIRKECRSYAGPRN